MNRDPLVRVSALLCSRRARPREWVLMIWGDEDRYGGPEIGQRAYVLPDERLEVSSGRHAPFLDDPERGGALIDELLRRPNMT